MNENSKILVTGASGLAGSAILRALLRNNYSNIVATYNKRDPFALYPEEALRGRCRFIKIDLIDQRAVATLFTTERPEYVFLAAARVGGIMANHTHRAQFIYENLQIQNNVIHYSYLAQVRKLLFLGSTCIYPATAPQPLKENYLMTDKLEYLSEPYGIAKIAGVKMCESYNLQYNTNFLAVMPTNLYGPNDNYDLHDAHFLPAFIRKMHLGKLLDQCDWELIRADLNERPVAGVDGGASAETIEATLRDFGITRSADNNEVTITLWGTGRPRREILHADELADACLYLMDTIDFVDLVKGSPVVYSTGHVKQEIRDMQINIGLGVDYTLYDIAMMVKGIVQFNGKIVWDHEMPDGTYQKLTDVRRLQKLGWANKVSLEKGVRSTYSAYQQLKSAAVI